MKILSRISDRITKFLIRFLIEYFWYDVFVDFDDLNLIYWYVMIMKSMTKKTSLSSLLSMIIDFDVLFSSSFRSQFTTISSSRWISKWFFRENSHSKSLFFEKWSAWNRTSLLSLKSFRLLISREQNYVVLAARLEFDDVLNLRVCLKSCLLNKLSYLEQLEEIKMISI